MYYTDPASGKRRRHRVRDLGSHYARTATVLGRKAAVDMRHRVHGAFAATRSRLRREDVPDEILIERIRSRLGMIVSHPHAVEVGAHDGVVTLKGPILSHEAQRAVRKLGRVRGVRGIEDRLDRHRVADDVPALQGGSAREDRPEFLQQNWAPAIRAVGGATGGTLLGLGVRMGGMPGGLVAGSGVLLVSRAVTNLPIRRLLGIGAGRRAVDIQKHIHIRAPREEVFAFFRNVENLPKFMMHLKSVSQRGQDGMRSHWVAVGPAGIPLSWDAELTRIDDNSVIAWRSAPHSTVRNAGIVFFEPDGAGGTHLHIRMHYNPPAGALGHAVAHLMGKDPKKAMDDDLLRLKSLLEAGRATAHGQTVTREELVPQHH
jgi:uncharacterized membrane protein